MVELRGLYTYTYIYNNLYIIFNIKIITFDIISNYNTCNYSLQHL